MVSSNDLNIVNLKNSIVLKINNLIGNHNEDTEAHEDIRESIPTRTSDLVNDDNFISEEWGTFAELQELIDNANSDEIIVLEKNYKNNGNEPAITFDNKNNFTITIDGNGYTIDGNTTNNIFFNDVSSGGVILNVIDVNFENGLYALYIQNTQNLYFKNCTFRNNQNDIYFGTQVMWSPTHVLEECVFKNTKGSAITLYTYGGAVQIIDSVFINTTIKKQGGYGYIDLYSCELINVQKEGDRIREYETNTNLEKTINKRTTWNSTPSHNYYPSEKLVKDGLNLKADISSLSSVATTGSYTDLVNKPNIPTKTSELTNDSGYLTEHQDISSKVDTTDSRLTDSRTPKSHSHGDITNTGTIGTTANKPLITTTNGKITTSSFGTTANTFVEGNDSRLSDSRTPKSHTHTKSEITDFPSIPSKTSDLTNDSNYISTSSTNGLIRNDGSIDTNTYLTQHQSLADYMTATQINTLLNDYLTTSSASSTYVAKDGNKVLSTNDFTNTYKGQLDNLASTIANAVGNLELFEIVQTLPTTNIKNNKLYLVPNSVDGTTNKYDVYIRVNNNWEKIDSLDFDINDYIKKTNSTSLLLANGNNIPQNTFANNNHNHDWTDINFIDDFTGIDLISSDGIGSVSAIGIIYDYNRDEIYLPTDTVYTGNNYPLLNATNIANNLTTTSNGFVLDARQGKWLNENKASITHAHGNISNDGKCSTTGTVDVSRGDLLLFADATTGTDQYKIKGSSFIDALNDLVLDLISEGDS